MIVFIKWTCQFCSWHKSNHLLDLIWANKSVLTKYCESEDYTDVFLTHMFIRVSHKSNFICVWYSCVHLFCVGIENSEDIQIFLRSVMKRLWTADELDCLWEQWWKSFEIHSCFFLVLHLQNKMITVDVCVWCLNIPMLPFTHIIHGGEWKRSSVGSVWCHHRDSLNRNISTESSHKHMRNNKILHHSQ